MRDKIELLIDELEERIAPGGTGGGGTHDSGHTHNSNHGTSHGSGSHGSK